MKLTTYLVFVALLPFLSGCLSMNAVQAANKHVVETTLYNSVDKIEKVGTSKDDQLWIFFEQDVSNSTPSHFALAIPLAQIRTNAQNGPGIATQGIMRATNHYDLYPKLSQADAAFLFSKSAPSPDKTNALFVQCIITSATLHVPGSTVRTNWTLLENSEDGLKAMPIGAPFILLPYDNAVHHGLDLTLLSNATQTVYLTRTTPIEFTYIDASIKRSLTIITVDPAIVTSQRTEHPGYYCLLPLTIPVDIATSPLQAIYYGCMYLMLSGLGKMH